MLSASTPLGRLSFLICLLFCWVLAIPATGNAADVVAGARVQIENMTKIPGSNVSFPADDFFTFSKIQNPKNSLGTMLLSSDASKMRIHNRGTSNLVITKLTTSNTKNFRISGVSIPSGGLTVAPGKSVTVTVNFVTSEGDPKRIITEKLVMSSNADNASNVNVTFRGAYMTRPEGGSEIHAMQVLQSFGFGTEMGKDGSGNYILRPSADYPKDSDVNAGKHGDLIVSHYFVQANPNKPVQGIHMAAYHGPSDSKTRFLGRRNVIVGGMDFNHGTKYHQSLLPNAANTGTEKAGHTSAKLDQRFKIAVAGFKTTGGTPTGDLSDKILGVRMYKVRDANGKIVPNAYIALMDYIGTGGGNKDWNDNIVYFSNIRPEAVPTAGSIANKSISAGQSTSLDVSGSFSLGYPGNKLTFAAARIGGGSLPSWVSLNKASGKFNFTPPSSAGGASVGIRVTGTDLNGIKVDANFTVTVGGGSPTPNQNPVARATASPSKGVAPLTVTLDGSSSSDSDGSIASYAWKWSGGSATGKSKTLTLAAGNYPVTLTVTDNDGAKDTDVVNITVDPAPTGGGGSQTYWLEAECAAVGSKWSVKSASDASNGKYVVVTNGNTYSVPSDIAANRVRFTVNTTAAGAFKMFARIKAPSGLDDSYFVRVNGGSWYAWSRGLAGVAGFDWKAYPKNNISLKAGTNTIDFAYREDGTLLDKIMLTTTSTVPSGTGGADASCSGTGGNTGTTTNWIEAECGDLGSGWSVENSSAASNGSYMSYSGPRDLTMPDGDDSDRIATYNLNIGEAGSYHFYMRLKAPTANDNSVWVKVDNGAWKEFWRELGGAHLLTNGFEWKKVNDEGKDVTFNLSAGKHVIYLANREKGTLIDKIYVGPTATPPSGMGGTAPNCANNLTMMALSTPEEAPAAAADNVVEQEIAVFPNPTSDLVNLQYRGISGERVDVSLLDMNGRQVRAYRPETAGGLMNLEVDVTGLPAGLYHFRIVSDAYAPVVKSFIVQ